LPFTAARTTYFNVPFCTNNSVQGTGFGAILSGTTLTITDGTGNASGFTNSNLKGSLLFNGVYETT